MALIIVITFLEIGKEKTGEVGGLAKGVINNAPKMGQ